MPPSHASIIARLLSAAAKNSVWIFTATTRARAQLTQVPPRRTTGWCPYWGRCSAQKRCEHWKNDMNTVCMFFVCELEMPFRFLKRRLMTTARFAWFWSTRNNHGLAQERRVCVLTGTSHGTLPLRWQIQLSEAHGTAAHRRRSHRAAHGRHDWRKVDRRRQLLRQVRRLVGH